MEIKEEDFNALAGFIKKSFGLNLFSRKIMVQSRLENYVLESGYKSFDEYFEHLFKGETNGEIANLINRLTTNYTYFMREINHFEHFKNEFLPWAEENVKDRDLRIWSAGCSYGNEAYNLAMCLDEFFGVKKLGWNLKILATDISFNALKQAHDGVYSKAAMENVSAEWKEKYFIQIDEDNFRVKDIIRKNVVFKYHNLMDSINFKKKFDLIVCRNVMIYFDNETRDDLCSRFYNATEDNGFLYIGNSEMVEHMPYKKVKHAIYRKIVD